MKLFRKFSMVSLIILLFLSIVMSATLTSFAQEPITMVLASMLPGEEHVYNRTLRYFAEKVDEYYDGPIKFDFHYAAELGTEKDLFEYMMRGVAVDVGIISPSHMATWDKRAAFMDAPFLFKNQAAWEEGMETEVFKPIADQLIEQGVRILGYGGGVNRHLVVNKPVWNTADLPGVEMRIQASPLHQKVFDAVGVKATPLDYMQVYDAIKTGVLDALENEPFGVDSMRFYEVAPYYVLTSHQMTVRVLCISEQRFQSFPEALQEAILKAGPEASAWHHVTEIAESEKLVEDLVESGQMKVIMFYNTEIRNRAVPVVEEYAKELGAGYIMEAIETINAKH